MTIVGRIHDEKWMRQLKLDSVAIDFRFTAARCTDLNNIAKETLDLMDKCGIELQQFLDRPEVIEANETLDTLCKKYTTWHEKADPERSPHSYLPDALVAEYKLRKSILDMLTVYYNSWVKPYNEKPNSGMQNYIRDVFHHNS